MAVHTAIFTVSALDLLIDKILKILLSDLSFLKLCFISQYMLLRILIESHHQLVALVNLRLLVQLHPSDMVRVQHVLVEPADLVRAVLALDALGEDFYVPPNFSNEGVPGALEHKRNGEEWIVLLLLQAGISQPPLKSYVALLFIGELVAHDLRDSNL